MKITTHPLIKNAENNPVKVFINIASDFVKNSIKYDYDIESKKTIFNALSNDIYGLFNIWCEKIGIDNTYSSEEFTTKAGQYIYQFINLLNLNSFKFVYIVDYTDLETDAVNKFVFVGNNLGFNSKSAAIADYRRNKRDGKFEYTAIKRHRIKFFGKPEVVKVEDLGFDFIHELVTFKI